MEHLIEMGAVAAICYGLGKQLKAHPRVKDYNIPFILMGVGIIAGAIEGSVAGRSVEGVVEGAIQGLISALFAVGSHGTGKQISERKKAKP